MADISNILSFEEFISRKNNIPRYDNFPYFFIPGSILRMGLLKQKNMFFKRLEEEQPILVDNLIGKITQIRKSGNRDYKEAEPMMHMAYALMSLYGARRDEMIGSYQADIY